MTQPAATAICTALFPCLLPVPCIGAGTKVEKKEKVSQFGITWTFDRAYPAGKFVNGDWWTIGPVRIVSVTPTPGPASSEERYGVKANQFGDTAFQRDGRMRNGSMVVLQAGPKQGYDSRKRNYDPKLSIKFPYVLEANRSLVSTISHKSIPNANFLKGHFEKSNQLLKTAAVLTCLPATPPADAFRPPYAGTDKPLYRANRLRRERLPALNPVGGTPDASEIVRYFERPWIDHMRTWLRVSPQENCPGYGREYSRVVGFGGCMLMLKIPPAEKEKLLLGFVQLGIDLYGLSQSGMNWSADGGIWSGRKWPILFAGIMLDEPKLRNLSRRILFHEDQQTYYGKSFWGHTVLWQMVTHHGPRQPYEEKDPATYDGMDRRSDSYRKCCNGHSWIGIALSARWFRGMEAWDHDAFFEYCDRWMSKDEAEIEQKRPGKSHWMSRATDKWITNTWRAYRDSAPRQNGAKQNMKWVWEGRRGKWVSNPRPGGPIVGPRPPKKKAAKNKTPRLAGPDAQALEAAEAAVKAAAPGAIAYFRQKIIAGVAAGKRPSIYIDMGGAAARGKIVDANARVLAVRLQGGTVRIPWATISDTRFAAIARKYAADPPTDQLQLAVVFAVAGAREKAGEILGAAGRIDGELKSLAKHIRLLAESKR